MVEKVARSISCLALMEEIMNIIYEKWDEILETVKTEHELSDVSFKTWLKPLTIQALQEEDFRLIEVPFRPTAENFSKFFYEKMTEKGYDVREIAVYETPNNCAIYSEN